MTAPLHERSSADRMPVYTCKTIKNELFDVEGDGGESSVSTPRRPTWLLRAASAARRRARRRAPPARPASAPTRLLTARAAPPSPPLPPPLPAARPQVAAFKARVAQNRACDVSAVKLICGGKVLKDEDSLDKAGVKDKAAGGFVVVMISAAKVRRLRALRALRARARERARGG